jgi:CheY-like chemotaxis protein
VGADPAFKGRRPDSENGRIGLRFSVWDTGPGIPKDRIAKLFKPYSQLDASVFRTHGGSGLGLVISQQLASLLGGRVWVESEEGKGATFHFTVVMKRTSGSSDNFSENDDAGSMSPSEELKGRSVLIFSSHRSNENLLKSYLTSWGMKVAHTNSVSQMMKWVGSSSAEKIPWVIVDTPNRLDLQAADFLRPFFPLIEAVPERRWIALTSQVNSKMKDALKSLSNARWVSKPIKPRTLLSGFVNLLKGRPAEVESNESTAAAAETQASDSVSTSPTSDRVKDPSRHLLLVEDNPVNQKIAMRALERAGWQVDVAADVDAVKSWLLSKRYRVALVDLWLPGMNGHEVARFIRSSIPKPQQPLIVALTAHSSEEEKQKCLESGMDAFMTKPIKTAELELTLNALEPEVPRSDVLSF